MCYISFFILWHFESHFLRQSSHAHVFLFHLQINPPRCDGKLVQLLPNYDIFVNRLNLQIIVNEAVSHKEGSALYVLRRLIPLVFSWEELACSCGQGLNCKTTENNFNKIPLDPIKVQACKGW